MLAHLKNDGSPKNYVQKIKNNDDSDDWMFLIGVISQLPSEQFSMTTQVQRHREEIWHKSLQRTVSMQNMSIEEKNMSIDENE